MAGFPMIETGYKPMFELGGVFAGENAANASAGAVQQLIEQSFKNQVAPEVHEVDMDYKRALAEQYRAQAEAAARDKTDPLKKAKASREMLDMLIPEMATVAEPYMKARGSDDYLGMAKALGSSEQGLTSLDAVMERIRGINPELADSIMKSANPAEAFAQQYKTRLEQTNPWTKQFQATTAADAKRNVAEIQFAASKLRTDTMERIAALKQAGVNVPKTAKNFVEQGNIFYNQAMQAQGKEQERLLSQAEGFYQLAMQQAMQAAMARGEGDIQFVPQPGTGLVTRPGPAPAKAPDPQGKPQAKASDF